MREEGELLICAVDLSCEKKRAEHGYLNGTQQTRHTFAYGHTFRNTPDPIWTRKLSLWGPGKYRGGGPRGKTFGCCRLLKIELTFRDLTHGLNPKRQSFFKKKSKKLNFFYKLKSKQKILPGKCRAENSTGNCQPEKRLPGFCRKFFLPGKCRAEILPGSLKAGMARTFQNTSYGYNSSCTYKYNSSCTHVYNSSCTHEEFFDFDQAKSSHLMY